MRASEMTLKNLIFKGGSAFILFFLRFSVLSALLPAGNPVLQDTVPEGERSSKQPAYATTRLVTERPVIDGKLDDECWKNGNWAGDYIQYIPHEGAEPTYQTEHNIQYDDKHLYIAIRAFDPEPDKVHRYAGVRDEIVGDLVGVNFDSYRDYRTGFEFTVSAWGQKVDLVLFNPNDWDFNWNAVWKAKVGLENSAWVAEIEVPLSQLRYSDNYELRDDYEPLPVVILRNPDFNFHQFRSNLVAKWEYRLGSYICFVWSSERTGRNSLANSSFGDSYGYLGDGFPSNIFLVKLNYWFSL